MWYHLERGRAPRGGSRGCDLSPNIAVNCNRHWEGRGARREGEGRNGKGEGGEGREGGREGRGGKRGGRGDRKEELVVMLHLGGGWGRRD